MNLLGEGGYLFFPKLGPRDRRAILLGLALLVPALLYILGIRPFRTALAEVQDRVSAERQLLERELALIESASTIPVGIREAELEAARAEDRMLRAPGTVLAEAELTDFLEMSASRSRVLLEEVRSGELARGEEPPPGLSVIRLELTGESDLQGVLSLLDEIEKSLVLLRVRGLALEPEVARPENGGDENESREAVPTGVVTFQLIVDGFARPEADPGTTGSSESGAAE